MDRTGQIFDGRYRLERLLGQGGMAAVYVARDRKLDKPVAVKILSSAGAAIPKAAQRFVQEARAVSRVHHPNVVDVTDFGVADDGAAYLVMELLRGEDLGQTLAREGPLPWSRVGPIALQICAALAAAHRAAVIHRDIKPSNCFRIHSAGNPDFIKVIDFGIARVVDPERRLVEPTTAGTVLGTPEYMAPEIAAGAEAGPAADLYAVGALIYKLLTGSAPFVAATYQAVLSKQIFEPPEPPRRRAPELAIPEAVETLVLRALAKDPAARHPDVPALAAAIAEALPQRSPVEMWLGPGGSGSAPRPAEPHGPEVVRDEPAGDRLAPTRTLVPAAPASRTVPLAPSRARARRGPRVAGGLALALAGALVGSQLAARRSGDMLQETGLSGHVESDMTAGTPSAGHEKTGAGQEPPGAGPREDMLAAARRAHANATPGAGEEAHTPGHADAAGSEPGAASSPGRAADAGAGSESDAAGSAARQAGAGEAAPASATVPEGRGDADAARDGVSATRRPGGAVPARGPRFDAEAARRVLAGAAARVQACAIDSDMQRGEIALRVAFSAAGAVAEVAAAPGSRPIEPAALTCMRRELAAIRVAPVAGEVVVAYVL